MNSKIRYLISGTFCFGILGYLVFASLTSGIDSNATLYGISAMTIYALIEIAVLSYAPSPLRSEPHVALVRRNAVLHSHRSMPRVARSVPARREPVLAA